MGRSAPTYRDGANAQLAWGLGLGASLLFLFLYADLAYLVEFREWLTWSVSWRDVRGIVAATVWRDDVFARSYGLLGARVLGTLWIDSPWLVNGTLLLLAPWTAVRLHRLAGMFGIGGWPALVALALWLSSRPVLDAVGWQATIHDRLGFLVAVEAMCLATRFVRAARGPWSTASHAFLLAVLTLVALNCKESMWFLPGALVLCAVSRPRIPGRAQVAWLLAPALAYSAYYFARYFLALRGDAALTHHFFGGTLAANAAGCARHLAPWFLPASPFAAPLLLLGALLLAGVRHRTLLVFGACLAAAALPPLPAANCPPYYMYAPGAFYWLCVALGLQALARRRVATRWLALGGAALLLVSVVRGVAATAPLRERSQQLQAAAPWLAAELPSPPPRRLEFVAVSELYLLLAGQPASFARCVLHRADWRQWRGVELALLPPGTVPAPADDTCRVGFADDGSVQELWVGRHRVTVP